ncbi:unnamed protein product [Microthlaspi erraticum]|uniref:Gnk2-homologous domain-containing protein n=1 Tax=Microthlaspi erraticum TaxID=1685480 RepID=A0A6D2IPA4_9BRAS|nr:unnamed protein product [Microthlaspi erraticum]
MYSSSSTSKRLVLVPVLAIQLLLVRSVSSLNMTNAYLNHKCMDSQGKYKPGSKYEQDLKDIIGSIALSSNFTSGYEMMSLGKGPSYVSVTLLCRGDSHGPNCRQCYATSQAELRRRCPKMKGGIIWYDQCFLVFSGISYFGKIDYDNNLWMSNAKKFSADNYSNTEWTTLIGNLTTIATDEKNSKDTSTMYAAGERRLGRKKLYGMVQCMPDISSRACAECVKHEILHFQECLFFKKGARVLGMSCNFRTPRFGPYLGRGGHTTSPYTQRYVLEHDQCVSQPQMHGKSREEDGGDKDGGEGDNDEEDVVLEDPSPSVSLRKHKDGFISLSYGEPPNSVAIVFQCRGDSYGPNCQSCYTTAVAALRQRCPSNKAGIIWYDQCFLNIGTTETPVQPTDYENTFSMHNRNDVRSDKVSFNKKTRDFLTGLMPKALKRDAINYVYYAAGETILGANKIYAMVQCAQNAEQCKACLESSIRELSKCCDGKQGARVYLGRSCNVRYELYPFLRTQKDV